MKNSLIVLVSFLSLLFTACYENENILFTDDFEAYELGTVPTGDWKLSGNGTINVSHEKSVSGNKAVHLLSGETYKNRAFMSLDHLFPLKENAYYGQFSMYVKEASPDGVHWTMIQSKGNVQNEKFSAEIRYGGQHNKKLMANYDTKGIKTDCWQHSEVKIPEGRWFSVQWHFDSTQNRSEFWLDGIKIDAITINGKGQGCLENELDGTWLFPQLEDVSIGWCDYQDGGGNRSIWIDDVIISKEKIK